MTSKEIREFFYSFFEKRKHYKVLSSSLVPAKDPTLLFTNAGMNQFKDIFLGKETRDYSRAVSIQKCMRVSGKHNDFDEVGRTDFHHTFFEMLGNFSFGDYFKEEAIEFAWELMTEHFKFDKEKLWVSVFKDDDEAFRIWDEKIGVPSERILRLDEKDNFWQMGETGPCGPCSEIHIDRGAEFGPPEFFDGNSRFVEVWNLVFMQYYKDESGSLSPLPSPSIDTGMGMERLTALLQKVKSNYDTDLFKPIIDGVSDISGEVPLDGKNRVNFNVIADHIRALTFLISDGVLPSNEGRGYVLRRLLRRASRHGRDLGFTDSFLYKITDIAVDNMSDIYPELQYNREFISEVVKAEEERFNRTLSRGLKLFIELINSPETKKNNLIPGKELFKLSDTYGFPLDFSRDLAKEKDIKIDIEGFNAELKAQKEKSRAQLKAQRGLSAETGQYDKYKSIFTGYSNLEEETVIETIFINGKETDSLSSPSDGVIITRRTPFYGESGGQVGDIGSGSGENFFCRIKDTKKTGGGTTFHLIKIEKGELKRGDGILLKVDRSHRERTAVHHTCTHMLQAALRETLGLHVKQSGSYVGPDKLRFDFTHYKALSKSEIERIETLINRKIRENIEVSIEENSYESAIESGAMAIFEEKYSDRVRIISLGSFSKELCGGTHLKRSGEAGILKIINESSIAAGIRRIEAVAGEAAENYFRNSEKILSRLEEQFKQKRENLPQFLEKLSNEQKKKNKKIKNSEANSIDLKELLNTGIRIGEFTFFVNFLNESDLKMLRTTSDSIIKNGGDVAVLFSNSGESSKIVVSVNKNLTKKVDASSLIKDLAALVKGNGGGRSDFAQAGGEKIVDPKPIISKAVDIVTGYLNV